MSDAGVGDSGHEIDWGRVAPGQRGAAAVAGPLDIRPFVARCGVAVIDPQEGADLVDRSRRLTRFGSLGRDPDDFSRPEIADDFVFEVGKGARFLGHGPGTVLAAENDRSPAVFVTRGIDPVGRQDQKGT